MLVINENDLKLLRMKEKLLEVSSENREEILNEYKNIVLSIDKNMFLELIQMIKNTNYHNRPLEEQLEIFTGIESEYNSFNEFQCRYRDIYEKYASDKLELSLISDIYIDKIREKINVISGYLINNKNLLNYRNILEKLNIELIDAEKKKDAIASKFALLEQDLKNNVLNAEGRLQDNNGNLEYTSVVKEFSTNGFDLIKLLDDDHLLEEELVKANSSLLSEEEKMEATKICFNNMPTIDTKKLYNISLVDVVKAKYRLVLLKLADLIAKEFTEYEKTRNKRIQIIDLIKQREELLFELEIKQLVDPFDRIKINEQLEIIELLGINIQNVTIIKEKIRSTFDIVEEIKSKNVELFMMINQDVELFNDRKSISQVVQEFNIEVDYKHVDNNKVIGIKEASDSFNYHAVNQKTDGVIARVYEMFTAVPIEEPKQSVVPELVIEKNDIFSDESSSSDNSDKIFEDLDDVKNIDADLFSDEIKPFEETMLFTNKSDDSYDEVSEEIDDTMPELFLNVDDEQQLFKEEENNGNDDFVPFNDFDEQINILLNGDLGDEASKIKIKEKK